MMDLLGIDFETFYDKTYSLDCMTTESYLRDPRFEVILASVKWNDSKPLWLLPEKLEQFLNEEVDWENTATVMHHAHFDGAILAWHYGLTPKLYIDTLSMARVVDGPKAGNSLEKLALRHGVGTKGDYVTYAKGKRLADFARDELRAYGDYCDMDNQLTYDLAQVFLPQMPGDELKLIDHNVRMFTAPRLVGNVEVLAGAVAGEVERKKALLLRVSGECLSCRGAGQQPDLISGSAKCKNCEGWGVDKKPFASSAKFADLIRAYDVEPPMKVSPATGERIFAFARTDPGMQDLLEHEIEEVRFLAETRIAVKSTLVESRAQRYLQCARNGLMPVYLNYSGAHTRRRSGGDKMNWQNMGRANELRPEMILLKRAIEAPPGHSLVASDSAQIQARLTAWFAGHVTLVQAFAEGRDVYSEFASKVYGRPIDRKNNKDDFIPGFVGKTCTLGLGFQMGWPKFSFEMLKGALGGPPVQFKEEDLRTLNINPDRFLNNPHHIARVSEMPSRLGLSDRLMHCIVCQEIVKRWRTENGPIVNLWDEMESIINALIQKREIVFGPDGILHTEGERIVHVNGTWIEYKGIQRDNGEASFWDGRKRTHIYGGLALENIIQWLETIVMNEDLLEIIGVGCPIVMQGHDELVSVVPDEAAQLTLQFMVNTMRQSPAWGPTLPLSAEGGIGRTYEAAKPK